MSAVTPCTELLKCILSQERGAASKIRGVEHYGGTWPIHYAPSRGQGEYGRLYDATCPPRIYCRRAIYARYRELGLGPPFLVLTDDLGLRGAWNGREA